MFFRFSAWQKKKLKGFAKRISSQVEIALSRFFVLFNFLFSPFIFHSALSAVFETLSSRCINNYCSVCTKIIGRATVVRFRAHKPCAINNGVILFVALQYEYYHSHGMRCMYGRSGPWFTDSWAQHKITFSVPNNVCLISVTWK